MTLKSEVEVAEQKLDEMLCKLLPGLDENGRVALSEVLTDLMRAIAEEAASDALDREFNRGEYRYG